MSSPFFRFWVALLLLTCQPALAEKALVFSTAANAPFHKQDGTGFIDLVLHEVGARIGQPIVVVGLPPERAIQDANSGLADGDAYRIGGLEKIYKNLIQVPLTLADMRFSAFSTQRDLVLNDWADLHTHSVAYVTGWKIFEAKVTDVKSLVTVRDPDQLFLLAKRGRADVVLFDLWQGSAFLETKGWTDIQSIDPPLSVRDMYLYVHKKHRDLVPEITAALREIKADGTYQALFDQIMAPFLND